MKYRSGRDIAARYPQYYGIRGKQTEIMQKAMLSFPHLKEYLQILKEAGMVEMGERRKDTIYFANERGMKLLKMYVEIDKMVPRTNMLTKAT